MPSKIFGPHKRRTRAHVIADLSVHHVEGFILEEGHTVQRLGSDYGYDLVLWTFDEQGYVEPDQAYFQLKAAETLQAVGSDYVYDLDVRDYNLWVRDAAPVFLVLFDASRKRAYWLAVQQYFWEDGARQPKKGAKTVRIRISKRRVVNRQALAKMRAIKWEARGWEVGDRP